MKSKAARDGAVRLFDHLVRCETRMYNALNDRLRKQHGIVTSQFEFLRYLRDHPQSRVADVAANFAIGIGSTSKGCDRLEHHGWIRRVADPDDRRSSILTLTAQGIQLVSDSERTFVAGVHELLNSAFTVAQLEVVTDALFVLRTALERDEIGVPAG